MAAPTMTPTENYICTLMAYSLALKAGRKDIADEALARLDKIMTDEATTTAAHREWWKTQGRAKLVGLG